MQKRTGAYDFDSIMSIPNRRGSPIPGPSHTWRNSPIHIPSDSESESGSKPLIHRKRRCYMYDSSTESENSIPPMKHDAIQSKEAGKILKDIKYAVDKYHEEAKRFRLWRELDEQKSALIFAFACLICKDVVSTDSTPVVPPCCRAAVMCMCKECLISWLEYQPSCPHCREPMSIDECLPMPPSTQASL